MMPFTLKSLDALSDLSFDEVVDVRSPAEFAEDHVPGAINLPVLSNVERARVGTIYVQQDRFLARKIGAALVARNAAAHIEGPLADRSGRWQPLVYCWRGGQRSGSFASILEQIGWRAQVLEGGYKSYRHLVVEALYDTPVATRVVLIDGGTGSAKTALLHHLARAGAQILDLEGMAGHRGSIFGSMPGGQPAQKGFETSLAMALGQVDPERPLFVEAESSKVGEISLPPSLWSAMQKASRIRVTAPLDARAAFTLRGYADLLEDRALLQDRLAELIPYHGRETIGAWQTMAAEGAFQPLAMALIGTHYDPRYARSAERLATPMAELALPDLSDAALAAAVPRILDMAEQPVRLRAGASG